MNRGGKPSARRTPRSSVAMLLAFVAFTGGLLAVVADYLRDPANLPIRTIRIQSEFRHLERSALQQILGTAVDGGFFSVDLGRVREAALSLPWVAEARVSRVWPDKLLVEVVEQMAVARWNDDGLVNSRGEVFHPKEAARPDLPLQFAGPDGKAAEMLEFYRRIQAALGPLGLQIRSVNLDPRGEWRLGFRDDMVVMVGREQKDFRIERLLGVYAVLANNERKIERIDLRYEQGFAVRWREEQS